jgi:hypothetical protein
LRVVKPPTKADRLQAGSVVRYPYLWLWQAEMGIETSKDRTACLVFELPDQSGAMTRIIVAVSDQAGDDVLELPVAEKRRAGLDTARSAFLHLGEYNIDPVEGSVEMPPNPRILGQLSEAFWRIVASRLAANIKVRKAKRIDRKG